MKVSLIKTDKDSYLSRVELINNCNQNITVPNGKAIQSRVR